MFHLQQITLSLDEYEAIRLELLVGVQAVVRAEVGAAVPAETGARDRGYRNRYYPTGLYGSQREMAFQAPPPYAPPSYAAPQISPQDEAQALREQLKYMEDSIKASVKQALPLCTDMHCR